MAATTVVLASEAAQDLEVSVVLASLFLVHSIFHVSKPWESGKSIGIHAKDSTLLKVILET